MDSKASVINQIKSTQLSTECRAIHKDLVFLLESATKKIDLLVEKENENAPPCPKCGNAFDPQCKIFPCGTCEECNELVCDECFSDCNECESIRCNKCMEWCEHCENHFCCGMVGRYRYSKKMCNGCVFLVGPPEWDGIEICRNKYVCQEAGKNIIS